MVESDLYNLVATRNKDWFGEPPKPEKSVRVGIVVLDRDGENLIEAVEIKRKGFLKTFLR